ncbi:phage-related replication protein [Streptomyces noursei ATCC 11455]|uniref:poly-gamma-glutamate hydrolase family protein n=1 Tax=Streptomyces noursei TaxID=1971 RepID=UPI00081C8AD8|nr:phage-related replication protein [Streptomyces noursei ATCC 11455]
MTTTNSRAVDTYQRWAELEAAETYGTDYRLDIRPTSSRVAHLAIHGGGIEAGTTELASAVASATGGQFYSMVGLKSADNRSLHLTSTRYDEPQALALQARVPYTVSYHGLAGTAPITHLGGADTESAARIGRALEAAGFAVEYGTAEDVNGDDPDNVTNRNTRRAGVQLEITRTQRAAWFPDGDLSRTMRESGRRTEEFYRYVETIRSVVAPLDGGAVPDDGLDWGQTEPDLPLAGYRFLFTDLRTDQLLDVLPVQQVAFDDYIGKTGTLRGTLAVPDEATAARIKAAVQPGRTALWVERGRDLWWGGIVWTATPAVDDRGSVSVALQAATFDSYWDHREIRDTLEARQLDQFDIARSLAAYAAGKAGGDIGIQIDYAGTSGVKRDRTYSRYDATPVREALDRLAAVENGFEWRIQVYRETETGERVKRLQLGYPKIQAGSVPVMLTYPGNVLAYSWPQDATGMANTWQSRGATGNQNQAEESHPLMSTEWSYPEKLKEGWPRLDGHSDYNSVEKLTTLDEHAKADLARARESVVIPSVRVRLDGEVTPALLGATVRLRIRDTWFSGGLDATFRVVGLSVTPDQRGQQESAEMYLEAA